MVKERDDYLKERLNKCWACDAPGRHEDHHVDPQWNGGADDPINIVKLCRPCHDIIDRYRFQRREILDWLTAEREADPGPRWARLMLLEVSKIFATHYLVPKKK